jgi:hypothetical protein
MPSFVRRDYETYHDLVNGFATEYFEKQRHQRLAKRATDWNDVYTEMH